MRAVLYLQILRWFLIVPTINVVGIGLCNGNHLGFSACKESEKQSLLMLKKDLKDPSNRLSSWIADEDSDCCGWPGVVCDHQTGHIHELHLGNSALPGKMRFSLLHLGNSDSWYFNSSLSGKISPSLLNLTHLALLNLSNNNFQGTKIPSFFGSLKNLTHLDLSRANFQGNIPHQLGNLSSLRDLRITDVSYGGLKVENLEWISGLSKLNYLDMSGVNLSKASDWLQVTNMLPSLEELHLSSCKLAHVPPLPVTNFTSLAILDLSFNDFYSLMPNWVVSLRNITSLKEIDFSFNDLKLPLPEWLFNQKGLTRLNLAGNSLHGSLPEGFSNITTLKYLILNDNHLVGKVPYSLGNLCKLVHLQLSYNNFSGDTSELFERLSACGSYNLEYLSLSQNNLSGHLTPLIGNFKKLSSLDLSANHFEGVLPETIGHLAMLTGLDISKNSFEGVLPETIGHLAMLTDMDISKNSFEGVVSEVHFTHLKRLESFIANGNSLTLETHRGWRPSFQLKDLNLDSWHLMPEFPIWLQNQRNLESLSLSNTGISGTIPKWFWNSFSQLSYLKLSNNNLSGEIDYIDVSFVDLSHNQFNGSLPLVSATVEQLDLSHSSFSGSVFHFFCDNAPHNLVGFYVRNNLLSGKIPDCWKYWQHLWILDLGRNKLTGSIPSSIGHLRSLLSLHLHNNHLSGELPLSMQNCRILQVLDLGGNKFSGQMPAWIGKRLTHLVILSFRSNMLQGDIPDQLCNLTKLQILDLAHNNISGTIPRCFRNFSAMVNLSRSDGMFDHLGDLSIRYRDDMSLVTKGREFEYSSILGFVTSLDLSGNIISGNIPEELTDLVCLQTLNLSENFLTGRIPSKIGSLVHLETLDLSKNKLYGDIPTSLAGLTFLHHLNFSYNNLTGHIPVSTQLQSLDQSSFVGNQLCGPPLAKNCIASNVIPPTDEGDIDKDRGYDILEDQWFYLSLGLGFMFGFWTIFGSLLVNLPWSAAYSRFLNSIVLKLYRFCL